MNIHFIAVGGAAMHNLALALHHKKLNITGSDDEIFEPSKSRLAEYDLLPKSLGWYPEKITDQLDAVILGMHARADNPELLRAKELNLPIYSYPEYLFEQTKDKRRVVIAGSHGKTTITAMIMHVLRSCGHLFDYMVGASVEGFDTMVSLSHEAPIAIFEGDEYLSSPIDRSPKFHKYKPQIALISGIAWDHINVFPTWDNYVEQFQIFVESIEDQGTLVYFEADEVLNQMSQSQNQRLKLLPYGLLPHSIEQGKTVIHYKERNYPLQIFGNHNLQNLYGAMLICQELGVDHHTFLTAITHFKGAAKRLQELCTTDNHVEYLDFAHSPSKLKASVEAVKQQFPNRKLTACMELHTFSSLSKNFLETYAGTMDAADVPIIYFDPKVIEHKQLTSILEDDVKQAFRLPNLLVFTDTQEMQAYLRKQSWVDHNLLFMSSGNFSGMNFYHWNQ